MIHFRKTLLLLDSQEDRPRADLHRHPVVGLGDPRRLILWKFLAAEDLGLWNQDIVVPRKLEAALDQHLPAIRGYQGTFATADLSMVRRVSRRVRVGGLHGVVQGCQESWRVLRELLGLTGKVIRIRRLHRVVLNALRHIAVTPSGHDTSVTQDFKLYGLILAAFDIGEKLKRQPHLLLRQFTGSVILDGAGAGSCLHAHAVRTGGEEKCGGEPPRGDVQRPAKDDTQVQCQAACDGDQFQVSFCS